MSVDVPLFYAIFYTKKIVIGLAILSLILGALLYPPTTAKSVVEVIDKTIPNSLPSTKAALQEIATQAAIKHGLHVGRFLATQECEIKKWTDRTGEVWDYKAQSDHINRKGIREDSWGAWQIHLPSHPSVTKEQAQDPYFATEFAARHWVEGRATLWSCYNNLFT